MELLIRFFVCSPFRLKKTEHNGVTVLFLKTLLMHLVVVSDSFVTFHCQQESKTKCACVSVCVCVRAFVHACARARVCVRARARVCVCEFRFLMQIVIIAQV